MAYSNKRKQEILQGKLDELASILEEKNIPFGRFEKCSSYHIKSEPSAKENALYVINENIGQAFRISYFVANPNGTPNRSGYQILNSFLTKPAGYGGSKNTDYLFEGKHNGDIFNPFTKEYKTKPQLASPLYVFGYNSEELYGYENLKNNEMNTIFNRQMVASGLNKPSYNGHWCTDINDTIEAIEEFMNLKEN